MSFSHGAGDQLQQRAPENPGRRGAGLRPRPAEIAIVVAVVALIVAACWPAINVSFGYSGNATAAGATPTAPASAGTTAQPNPSQTFDTNVPHNPVVMNAPTVLHSTGAELSWPTYENITGSPAYDVAAYEVHRSTNSDFTPSPATLVATVNAHDTSFVDTTAPASSGPNAGDYFYMLAVRTKSGQLIDGTAWFVQLPRPGRTELVLPADGATMISSAAPDNAMQGNGLNLSVTPDMTGDGDVERTLFEFGPLKALPSGAVVTDARLSVWCNGSTASPVSVYGMTRTFDATQATWKNAANYVPWTRPGGDYTTPSGAAVPMDTADPQVCEFNATAIVHSWTRLRSAGHGLLLKDRDETSSNRFGSFSAGDTVFPGHGPQLVVTYESRA